MMQTKTDEIVEAVKGNHLHGDCSNQIIFCIKDIRETIRLATKEIFEEIKSCGLHYDHDAFCNQQYGVCETLIPIKNKWLGEEK